MIITFLYDLILCFALLLSFPKLFFDFLVKRKYRKSLGYRIAPTPPKKLKKPLIWLHAVSVGEVKALSTLIPHIRRTYPDVYIYVTTVTETGQQEAKKSCIVDGLGYLPLDFSWIMKRFVRRLNPFLLVLVEGDYWFNLINEIKKVKGKIVVVNGKLSEKSMKRFLTFSFFSRLIFHSIDYFCLQGESYFESFLKLWICLKKLKITGNLKFDVPFPELGDLEELKRRFDIQPKDRVITLGSTHKGEEELLYKSLIPALIDPHLKILICPRHSERFTEVKNLINHPQIYIVDQMGILPKCYSLSYLAIIGGSFVKKVGGNNIFEPAKMGIPTLYGPYMYKQVDLDRELNESGAGMKVKESDLLERVLELLNDPELHLQMTKKGKCLAHKLIGASSRTWNELVSNISLEKN